METVSYAGAAQRLGITEKDVCELVDNGELVEPDYGKILLKSVYAYSGLNPGGRQTTGQRPTPEPVQEPKQEPDFTPEVTRVYTIAEASRKIGFKSDSTIQYHIKNGTIRRVEGGVDADTVDAFIRVRKAEEKKAKSNKPLPLKPKVKLIGKKKTERPAKQMQPPLLDDAIFKDVEEEFFNRIETEPVYTETQVKEALKEAYRKGMEAAYKKLKGAA